MISTCGILVGLYPTCALVFYYCRLTIPNSDQMSSQFAPGLAMQRAFSMVKSSDMRYAVRQGASNIHANANTEACTLHTRPRPWNNTVYNWLATQRASSVENRFGVICCLSHGQIARFRYSHSHLCSHIYRTFSENHSRHSRLLAWHPTTSSSHGTSRQSTHRRVC